MGEKNYPLIYLHKIEWSMGNGQCPECHGLKPYPSVWIFKKTGHKPGCLIAKAIDQAGGQAKWLLVAESAA